MNEQNKKVLLAFLVGGVVAVALHSVGANTIQITIICCTIGLIIGGAV